MHILSEAKRVQPCVLFIPHIDSWWENDEYALLRSSLLAFLQDLEPTFPLLLFATSDRPAPSPVQPLGKLFASAVVECTAPSKVIPFPLIMRNYMCLSLRTNWRY